MLYAYSSINITPVHYCGRRINGWTMVQSFIMPGSPSIHFSYQKVNSGSINSAECVSQAFQLPVTYTVCGTAAAECGVAKLKGSLVLKPIPYMGYCWRTIIIAWVGLFDRPILILLDRFSHVLKSNVKISRSGN